MYILNTYLKWRSLPFLGSVTVHNCVTTRQITLAMMKYDCATAYLIWCLIANCDWHLLVLSRYPIFYILICTLGCNHWYFTLGGTFYKLKVVKKEKKYNRQRVLILLFLSLSEAEDSLIRYFYVFCNLMIYKFWIEHRRRNWGGGGWCLPHFFSQQN